MPVQNIGTYFNGPAGNLMKQGSRQQSSSNSGAYHCSLCNLMETETQMPTCIELQDLSMNL